MVPEPWHLTPAPPDSRLRRATRDGGPEKQDPAAGELIRYAPNNIFNH